MPIFFNAINGSFQVWNEIGKKCQSNVFSGIMYKKKKQILISTAVEKWRDSH